MAAAGPALSEGAAGRRQARAGGRREAPDGGDPAAPDTRPPTSSRSDRSQRRRLVLIAVMLVVTVVGIVLARGVRDAAEARAQTAAAGEREDPGATPGPDWGLEPGAGSPSSASAGSTAESVPPGSSAQPSGGLPGSDEADWWTVLDGLDARRAQAIATADAGAIGSYAATSSAFDRSEVQLIGQLARDRLHPRGWRTTVIAIESVDGPRSQGSDEWVVLTVVDERSAYELVDEAGTVVRQMPLSAKRRWHITLTRQIGEAYPSDTGADVGGDRAGGEEGHSPPDPAGVASGSGATPDAEQGPGAPGTDQGLDDARSAVADDDPADLPGAEGDAASGSNAEAGGDSSTPRPAPSASPGEARSPASGDSAQDWPAGGASAQASTWRIASVELLK